MRSVSRLGVVGALAAAALVAAAYTLPLWRMTMKAPQYRNGLTLCAYGSSMTGDIRELNILNHYIGMPPLEMTCMWPSCSRRKGANANAAAATAAPAGPSPSSRARR